jgi:DNA mismatch repair ATPase MutS
MGEFIGMHQIKSTYRMFCTTTQTHMENLIKMRELLDSIQPISNFAFKIGSVGYLLKCYYDLYANVSFERSLRYSFGFEGFLDNLRGIHTHLQSGSMTVSQFSQTHSTSFYGQYYPPLHTDPTHVKNDCHLDRKMIVTGPNASGKTTYLKTTMLNIIMSQQFGCGFYQKSVLRPYTHLHSYLNIPDTSERYSLFQSESRRCKEILTKILEFPQAQGYRHFCIFDELYSGTNPSEATKSAFAFMKYMKQFTHVDFILTTHYVSICKKLKPWKEFQMRKMDVVQETDRLKYTYEMKKGYSKIQGAIYVLKDMNYPEDIIQTIQQENEKMEPKPNPKV